MSKNRKGAGCERRLHVLSQVDAIEGFDPTMECNLMKQRKMLKMMKMKRVER